MKTYYYVNSRRQTEGPASLSELAEAGIRPETLVWSEGMPEWIPARDIPELQTLFGSSVPPLPGQAQHMRPPHGMPAIDRPNTYLWLGILTTILCCLPMGIVSIVYAAKVDSYWYNGNIDAARDSSLKARNWGIASAVSAIAIYVIYAILIVAGVVSASYYTHTFG